MKRILIIVVVAILLACGTATALYLFMPDLLGLAPQPEAAPPPPPPVSVKPHTVQVGTIDLSIFEDGVPRRQLHFAVTLVTTPEAQAKVAEDLPRFRNAVVQFGYGGLSERLAEAGTMDLPRLKATLLVLARQTLGDGVQDLLIQSYFEM